MNPPTDTSFLYSSRRSFLRRTLAAGAGAAVLPGLFTRDAKADQPPTQSELNVLNFALNLEYLEAEYYTLATTGKTLAQSGIGVDGVGTQGSVTVKDNPMVSFTDSTIGGIAAEIASDEQNHVKFLRDTITAAGHTPAAEPNIDLLNSFNALSVMAGIGETFDPFADEVSFLLGAFIFEDVGVTAYRGGSTKIGTKAYLLAAAGILAVEAIHAGEIRALLFAQGSASVLEACRGIAAARSDLDGSMTGDDQGIVDANNNANIVPTDTSGLVFSRNKRRVLNIVYGATGATSGGFFPTGANSGKA